jgi:amino acid transporter
MFWVTVVFSVAQCRMSILNRFPTRIANSFLPEMEIVTLFPLDGSFIRLAGRMVDPALGVAVGWNHFVRQPHT